MERDWEDDGIRNEE
jgi:hypothetical protein